MTGKFWDSEEVDGHYMEVVVTADSGDEYIYWVSQKNRPEEDDEYDWSIDRALALHNKEYGCTLTSEDAEALEPFSRYQSEFTFVE